MKSLFPSNVNSAIVGPLEDCDNQRVVVPAKLDVLKELGVVQGADRFANPQSVYGVADIDRQIIEDRAVLNGLVALDAEIFDDPGIGVALSQRGARDTDQNDCPEALTNHPLHDPNSLCDVVIKDENPSMRSAWRARSADRLSPRAPTRACL